MQILRNDQIATADAMSVTYRAVDVHSPNQPIVNSVRFTLTPGDVTPQVEAFDA